MDIDRAKHLHVMMGTTSENFDLLEEVVKGIIKKCKASKYLKTKFEYEVCERLQRHVLDDVALLLYSSTNMT